MMEVTEGNTGWYSCDITGFVGTSTTRVTLQKANIATLLVTLYVKKNQVIINSRDRQDVVHSGAWDRGVTIDDTTGRLTFVLEPADNAVVGMTVPGGAETHVILFEGTTAGNPSHTFNHQVEYLVRNKSKL